MQPAGLVGQQEIRHRLAGRGGLASDTGCLQPRDHALDDVRELRAHTPDVAGEGGKTLRKPSVHVAAALGARGKLFGKNLLGHVTPGSVKATSV